MFKKHKDRIDGVLLDMIMPDMGGRQVLNVLKKIRPDIKVVLSSGYSLEGLWENGQEPAGDGFLKKPYQIKKLTSMLNRVRQHTEPPSGEGESESM